MLELPNMVLRLAVNHDTTSVIIQYVDGSIWQFSHGNVTRFLKVSLERVF